MTLKPIKEAPQDGTPVYLYWPGCKVMPLAWWTLENGVYWGGEDSVFKFWVFADEMLNIGQEGEGGIGWDGDPVPTHFMPVPKDGEGE